MNYRKKTTLAIILFIYIGSFTASCAKPNDSSKFSSEINLDNSITLTAYEYQVVSVNATKGQLISGDWEATPATAATFLIFIIDSDGLTEWENSNDLEQAINRIPSSQLLYLYDPIFNPDDFLGDNYRTGTFQKKAPYDDIWNLVLYAGATLIPTTFYWHIDVWGGIYYDIVMYFLGGIIVATSTAAIIIKIRKDKKKPYEEEFSEIVNEYKEEESTGKLGSLEEDDEENDFSD
ncbi:MAG: hypothetical protein FK734_11790 [Asgard group archaeon]|nr:hypothetical protein [Asgard group archaeon]